MGRARGHFTAVAADRFDLVLGGRRGDGGSRLDSLPVTPGSQRELDTLLTEVAGGSLAGAIAELRRYQKHGTPALTQLRGAVVQALTGIYAADRAAAAWRRAHLDAAHIAPRHARHVIVSYGVFHLTRQALPAGNPPAAVQTLCGEVLNISQYQPTVRGLWGSGRQRTCTACAPHAGKCEETAERLLDPWNLNTPFEHPTFGPDRMRSLRGRVHAAVDEGFDDSLRAGDQQRQQLLGVGLTAAWAATAADETLAHEQWTLQGVFGDDGYERLRVELGVRELALSHEQWTALAAPLVSADTLPAVDFADSFAALVRERLRAHASAAEGQFMA